jgi:hypothetical protein
VVRPFDATRFLTLQRDFHQIMAGGSSGHNGKNGHGYGQPFPPSFVSQEPGPAAPSAPPEPEGPASLVLDGQEYVAGRV